MSLSFEYASFRTFLRRVQFLVATAPPGSRRTATAIILSIFCALLFAACGKVGPPVAPLRLTVRTEELSAVQRGSSIVLEWPAPPLGQKEGGKFFIARADVYRLTEQRDQLPILDPDDYEELAQPVGYLDRKQIEDLIKGMGHLEFADVLNLTSAADLSKIRLRYAIRYVNSREQSAKFSNSVSIEPFATIASRPSKLEISAPKQDVIELKWAAPDSNVDGSKPAAVIGYNVYRRKADTKAGGQLLNQTPIADTTFVDSKFQYKVDYTYFVRAVSPGATGLLESADSQLASFEAVDTFSPAAPDPVSIASANGVISLFWPSSVETDVVGYNVYRSDGADGSPESWAKITRQPVITTTFRDDQVVIDRAYSYRITAVDQFDNESAPSRVVTETVHP